MVTGYANTESYRGRFYRLNIPGASSAEASSVMAEFQPGTGTRVLRGEEFNSVNESGNRVIRALAAEWGLPVKI